VAGNSTVANALVPAHAGFEPAAVDRGFRNANRGLMIVASAIYCSDLTGPPNRLDRSLLPSDVSIRHDPLRNTYIHLRRFRRSIFGTLRLVPDSHRKRAGWQEFERDRDESEPCRRLRY
jgi:hypothetical protein